MFVKLAAGAAAIGGLAAPALAQYPYQQQYPQQAYPQYQYPQAQYPQAYPQAGYAYPGQAYGQQGYGAQNSVGAIIGQLLGNRYNVTDRTAVTQCATAAVAQAASRYQSNGYGQGYSNGYNNGYHHAYGSARVTGITNVERRNRGLRVSGLMSSGVGGRPWGNQGYNPAYANVQSDLTFRCNVDYRGAVTNVRVNRNNAYRG
jgi:hypothetical protein